MPSRTHQNQTLQDVPRGNILRNTQLTFKDENTVSWVEHTHKLCIQSSSKHLLQHVNTHSTICCTICQKHPIKQLPGSCRVAQKQQHVPFGRTDWAKFLLQNAISYLYGFVLFSITDTCQVHFLHFPHMVMCELQPNSVLVTEFLHSLKSPVP